MTNSHDTSTPAMSAETVPSEELARRAITQLEFHGANSGVGYRPGILFRYGRSSSLFVSDLDASTLSASHLAKEGGEGVVVPYDDFHAAYQFVPRSKMSPDQCLKTRLRSLLRDEDLAHADEAEAIAAAPAPNPSPAAKGGEAVPLVIRKLNEMRDMAARPGELDKFSTMNRHWLNSAINLIHTLATPSPQPADAVREALAPFAKLAADSEWNDVPDKHVADVVYRSMAGGEETIGTVTFGELRSTRAALASDPAPAGEAVEPVAWGAWNGEFYETGPDEATMRYRHEPTRKVVPLYAHPAPEDTARLREEAERFLVDLSAALGGFSRYTNEQGDRRLFEDRSAFLLKKAEELRLENDASRRKCDTAERERDDVWKALEDAALWHDAQDKAISKQPNANVGHNGWMRNEHQGQARTLRAAARSAPREGASDGE